VVKLIPTRILQFCYIHICMSICSTFSIVPSPSHQFQHLLNCFTTSQSASLSSLSNTYFATHSCFTNFSPHITY
jgi:hypothetical protein